MRSNQPTHRGLLPPTAEERKFAKDFFTEKLQKDSNMPRYNHCAGAMYSSEGNERMADVHYKTAINSAPGNIMTRNDFALHMSKYNRHQESFDEFKKAIFIAGDQPTLSKNYGAALARNGQFQASMENVKRAVELNKNDAMNHRNYARVKDVLGDSESALKHNLISVQLEQGASNSNTDAYRSAAVQLITRGHGKPENREKAYELMDAARQLEGKVCQLQTTQRTNEVLAMILKRTGDKMAQIEAEKKEEEDKKKAIEDMKKNAGRHFLRKDDVISS